jgi:hypothetical protein
MSSQNPSDAQTAGGKSSRIMIEVSDEDIDFDGSLARELTVISQ